MMLACTLLGALQRYYNLLLNAWTRKYHKQHSKGQLRIGNNKSKTHIICKHVHAGVRTPFLSLIHMYVHMYVCTHVHIRTYNVIQMYE